MPRYRAKTPFSRSFDVSFLPVDRRNVRVHIDHVTTQFRKLTFNGFRVGSKKEFIVDITHEDLIQLSTLNDEEKWITVNGGSEIVVLESKRLAAGASTQDSYCVGPSVAVVSLKRKARRQVPVQGKLRISQSYFVTEHDWLTQKLQ